MVDVTHATDSRLYGDIEKACAQDKIIEGHYKDNKAQDYYQEDYLFEIESHLRMFAREGS